MEICTQMSLFVIYAYAHGGRGWDKEYLSLSFTLLLYEQIIDVFYLLSNFVHNCPFYSPISTESRHFKIGEKLDNGRMRKFVYINEHKFSGFLSKYKILMAWKLEPSSTTLHYRNWLDWLPFISPQLTLFFFFFWIPRILKTIGYFIRLPIYVETFL